MDGKAGQQINGKKGPSRRGSAGSVNHTGNTKPRGTGAAEGVRTPSQDAKREAAESETIKSLETRIERLEKGAQSARKRLD